MAKKAGKKREKRNGSAGGWFGRFLMWKPVRFAILAGVVVVIIILLWPVISAFGQSLLTTFGWGIVLLEAAVAAIAIWIALRRARSFLVHFNRWFGAFTLGLAVWGILAFAGQGGTFGDAVAAKDGLAVWGVLRIIGLLVLGLILIWPTIAWNMFLGLIQSIRARQRTAKTPTAAEAADTLPTPAAPNTAPVTPGTGSPIPALKKVLSPRNKSTLPKDSTGGESPKELKQVAQEVWKKYGMAGGVTVDGWRLPPIDILDKTVEVEFSEADNQRRARLIEESLQSYGVETKVVQINVGPTVTQFGIEPGWDRKFKDIKEKDRDGNVKSRTEEVSKTRVKVDRITSLANDMALALAAPSLRIEAPVPGKSIVGIEVPNTVSAMVSLRSVVETSVFQKLAPKTKLAVALGKGAGGEAVSADLAKMPHLLIAGATGSGKTVCLQTLICCLLMHCTPNDVRFVMIDPKRVELVTYAAIPHLATPVIVDPAKALNALRWLNSEMDRRYQKLAADGARNIEGYNKDRKGEDRMPFIVLVIDELADLMMAGFDETETIICRLAQLARAIGIHLVVATQRPSVDVITGLIKANFPTRISFAVTSQVDSRTILDNVGAEKLLGKGDMLYMPTDAAKPKRLQGVFLSDPEMERLVYFWSSQNKQPSGEIKITPIEIPDDAEARGTEDPLMDTVRALSDEHSGHLSTSFLQRKLHIGYPRAARLMEDYEAEHGPVPEPEIPE